MAEPCLLRRSGRKRQASRKYSAGSFEEFQGLGSDSDDNEKVQHHADAERDDHEFANENENDVEYIVDHDEVPNGSGNVSSAAEDDAEDADGEDPDADADINEMPPPLINDRGSDSPNHAAQKEKNLRYQVKAKKDPKDIVRSKGLIEISSKNPSKEDMLKFMAGGYPQDWVDFLRTKDRWLTDPTLPTRDGSKGKGGMCHHFSHTEDKRKMEATVGWDWYYDQGGRELFAKRQRTQILTPDEGHGYIPKSLEQSHKFLMGPYGKQQVFRLQTGHSMCLDDAWKFTHETNPESTKLGELRDGWMLYLGTSVKCLDWATNQDGDVQYLAAATAQPKMSPSKGLSEVSPAYTPSAPLWSCIQIWGFAAKKTADHETSPSPRQPPALKLVICTEWGEIKQLKWCQIPRKFRGDDFPDKIPLGLLAGVWSDGLVRVLDVQLNKNKGATASYVKYDEPAFKAWAPNTLCTCVTWLSASTLAVGFANGFLAIWDISQESPPENNTSTSTSISSPPSTHPPPRPWLYISLHQSYILALTSAYPSYPHLLSTSSVDGHTRLTDLRAPTTDYTLSNRSRNTSPLLTFSPSTLSMLSTEENDFARLFPLRSFHSSVAFARATASPLSLAANSFHPCVLMGCADGSLIATNPLPRVWNRKWPYYQQIVFRHEWTRGKRHSNGHPGSNSGAGGISRITESYKIIQPEKKTKSRGARSSQPSKPANAANAANAPMAGDQPPNPPTPPLLCTTIYEENTGITQVAWNPNLPFGGWMAAGMGSGLVRVQDLAV